MLRLPNWLLLFLPYRRSTLHLPLPIATVQQIIYRSSDTKLTTKPASAYQKPYYYKLRQHNGLLLINGPYGYRRWCLFAQGQLQPSAEGTDLHLHLRFDAQHLFTGLLALIFYAVGAFWLFGSDIRLMAVPIALQLVFMYGILLAIFQDEASRLIRRLKQLFMEQSAA